MGQAFGAHADRQCLSGGRGSAGRQCPFRSEQRLDGDVCPLYSHAADGIVPFLCGQIALQFFSDDVHHDGHGNDDCCQVAFDIPHPESVLLRVIAEVHDPVVGLDQGHRLHFILIGDPQVHMSVIAGREKQSAIELHFRNT